MKDIVFIPGLFRKKFFYRDIRKTFRDEDFHYFPASYGKDLDEIADDLKGFLADRKIQKANFITHSFGSVVLKIFYSKNPEAVGRVLEICPFNHGCMILEEANRKVPFLYLILGKSYREYIERKEEICSMPNPPEPGVIAGSRRMTTSSGTRNF